MNEIKKASTKYPVLESIKNRWSPRSFSDKAIGEAEMNTIIEAATWSFSAMNEQPWRYVVAYKGTPLFDSFFQLLAGGNQPWNKQAAVLLLSVLKTTYNSNDHVNINAAHDTGAANMLLTLQANSMGIYTHLMEGFSKPGVKALLGLGDGLEPGVMIALGYPDDAEKLAEPFKTRELTPRVRKGLDEIILQADLK